MTITASYLRGVYRMWPNRQTVTLVSPLAASSTITDCVRRPWDHTDYAVGGNLGMESDRVSFLLPTEILGTTVPGANWTITDADSNVWNVLSVRRELEGSIFRCTCVKQVS